MENEVIIRVENLEKIYKVGQYGKGSLTADLQTWWAHVRKKEDPDAKIGSEKRLVGTVFKALRNVSFEINQGDRVGIIGGNGAGKSTLLKLLCKITAPTAGKIMYNGRIASMLEVGTGFNPEMTGRENIYLNGAILGMTKAEIDRKFEKIVEFSECADFIDTPVKRYSSGMYVKLAFSVAAHLDSEIVIMDEVLAVGDMAFQKKCLRKMKELATDEGRTILYVSHNMSTIQELCNKCIVLRQGKVEFMGDVAQAIDVYNENSASADNTISFNKNNSSVIVSGAQMNKIVFSAEKMMHYNYGDKIQLRLFWTPKSDVNKYYFRIMIKDERHNSLGMTNCCLGSGFEPHKEREDTLQFDSGLLTDGTYFFEYEMSYINSLGNVESADWQRELSKITISGCNKEPTPWNRHFWGNIRFNKLEKVNDEH